MNVERGTSWLCPLTACPPPASCPSWSSEPARSAWPPPPTSSSAVSNRWSWKPAPPPAPPCATRLGEAGLATTEENDTTCCYALQDKVWVHGPGQEPWEVYVVKADADTLTKQQDSTCCTSPADADTKEPAVAGGCC
jgi:hypothetical protein